MARTLKSLEPDHIPTEPLSRIRVKESWTKPVYDGPGVASIGKGTFKNDAQPLDVEACIERAKQSSAGFAAAMKRTLAHAAKSNHTTKKD